MHLKNFHNSYFTGYRFFQTIHFCSVEVSESFEALDYGVARASKCVVMMINLEKKTLKMVDDIMYIVVN